MTQIQNYYSLTDFENFLFNGIDYKLSSSVLDIIANLEKELGSVEINNDHVSTTSSIKKPFDKKPFEKKPYKNDYGGKKDHRSKNKEISNDQWETIRNFKTTKIETKEGIDKRINDIRILLNKISSKNYDAQKPIFIQSIKDFFDELDQSEDSDNADNLKKLNKVIFDIICSNKVFSELYSNLYKELIEQFDYFNDSLNTTIVNYMESLNNIHYVDPNINYDGFCSYTKLNDNRKAITLFLTNALKNGVLQSDTIIKILNYLLDKSLEYINEHNRTNELEEITENVFIYVSACEKLLANHEIWKDSILTKITSISQMKNKDHPSLSNRIIFKYMDIIDTL